MRIYITFGALILGAGALFGTIIASEKLRDGLLKPLPSATVRLTPRGFEPERIVLQIGGTVTFMNETEKAFWPASNFHPLHSAYPEFDPLEPIPAGESWSFTFEKQGVWRYHDHLAPYFEGTIDVEAPAQEYSGCKVPRTYDCWRVTLLEELEDSGVEKTLEHLKRLYESDPLFPPACHSLAHDIGLKSYALYREDPRSILTPLAGYCAHGFYHGFMEAFLTATRDPERARDACNFIGKELGPSSPEARLQCFHGIGHGAVELGLSDAHVKGRTFTERNLLDPSLLICEAASESDEELYRCSSGAFNAIANFYITGEFGLVPDREDPLWICREYPEQFRESCYGNLNSLLAWLAGNDFKAAIPYIEAIESDRYAVPSMRYLASIPEASNIWSDPEQSIAACRSAEARLRTPCIEGLAHSFLEHGQPGAEEKGAIAFCSKESLAPRERDICFTYVFSNLRGWFSPARAEAICAEAEPALQPYCKKETSDAP